MLIDTTGKTKTSDTALKWLIGTAILTALLAVPHGVLEGWHYGAESEERSLAIMLATMAGDTRYLCENLVYVAAFIFVGAKFFETRTTFAVTFDRVDADRLAIKGPDGDNVVWIGQRYGTPMEAQSVAAVLENRLRDAVKT